MAVFTCAEDRCPNRCQDTLALKIAAIRHTLEQVGWDGEKLVLASGEDAPPAAASPS